MKKANDYQVGGGHYRSSYIHWDWVLDTNQGYLEGNATKYVSRARKKNGLQDLEKADHYVAKIIECSAAAAPQKITGVGRSMAVAAIERFTAANDLSPDESEFCSAIVFWRVDGIELLNRARDLITALKALHQPPVLSDSNKHASEANKTEDDFARHNEIAKSEKRT